MNQVELWGDLNDPSFSVQQKNLSKVHLTCSWEKIAPRDSDHHHWELVTDVLDQLAENQLTPVVNFLNHDSGPFYTSLIEPDFAIKFATFCRHFITRFPTISYFSPIYDIHVTAANSYLNGRWAPHLESKLYYYKALIAQCMASILAMREIRRVNPLAGHIQFEDSTEDPARNWPALDIIYGKVNEQHPLFIDMLNNGIRKEEILCFQDNYSKVDMLQLNTDEAGHYEAWEQFQTPLVITDRMTANELQNFTQNSVSIAAISIGSIKQEVQ